MERVLSYGEATKPLTPPRVRFACQYPTEDLRQPMLFSGLKTKFNRLTVIAKGGYAANACITTPWAALARMAQPDCHAKLGVGFAIVPVRP